MRRAWRASFFFVCHLSGPMVGDEIRRHVSDSIAQDTGMGLFREDRAQDEVSEQIIVHADIDGSRLCR